MLKSSLGTKGYNIIYFIWAFLSTSTNLFMNFSWNPSSPCTFSKILITLVGIMIRLRWFISFNHSPVNHCRIPLNYIFFAGYINQSYGKTGYWVSLLAVIIGSSLLSLIDAEDAGNVLHSVPLAGHDPPVPPCSDMSVPMSVVGPYLHCERNNIAGNHKENLPSLRRLSYSDPYISHTQPRDHTITRQDTWHTLLSPPPPQQQQQHTVIEQITSTVWDTG